MGTFVVQYFQRLIIIGLANFHDLNQSEIVLEGHMPRLSSADDIFFFSYFKKI